MTNENPGAVVEGAPSLDVNIGSRFPNESIQNLRGIRDAANAFAATINLPAHIGAKIVGNLFDAQNAYNMMNEDSRALWARQQGLRIKEIHGEATADKIAKVHQMVGDTDFVKRFPDGVLSAEVLHDLIVHSERLAASK